MCAEKKTDEAPKHENKTSSTVWKMLGAGIAGAAVIASPIAGGAAVGTALLLNYRKKKKEKEKEATHLAAENIIIRDRLDAFLASYKENESSSDYQQLISALCAVACMTANYDDKTNWREVQEIRDFFSKVRDSELSDEVKNKVVNFFQNPPDLKTAYEEAKKVKNCPKEIFEGMIRLIVACDGVVSEKEEELLRMWNAFM